MTPVAVPTETYLRRPRVLVLLDDHNAPSLLKALRAAPVAPRAVKSVEEAALALKRSYVTVIVCDPAAAAALATCRRKSTRPPVFLLYVRPGRGVALPKDVAYRVCEQPIDARRVVGDVLALTHGWQSADTRPIALDDRLSVIPDCGLLFCDDGLVPLLRMERLVLTVLLKASGRLVTWAELGHATGASQKLLYVSADRLRRKLEEFIPGHSYLETQPGRGLRLDLDGGPPKD